VTARERATVRALRDLVSDDDGAMEVLDALDDAMREHIEAMADLTS